MPIGDYGLRIDCGMDCGFTAPPDSEIRSAIRIRQSPFTIRSPNSAVRIYAGAIAMTRSGLPLPRTIFNGAAITTAPVGGS
jgi:hypothetical protein